MIHRIGTALILLSLSLGFQVGASSRLSHFSQEVADVRSSVNGAVASLYAGACKAPPDETQAESDRIEALYFPLAAKKLVSMNRCEILALTRLLDDGYDGKFIRKVVQDIAVKLPSLRKLSREILKLNGEIDEMNRENNAYDAQLGRYGFLSDSQQLERHTMLVKLKNTSDEMKPKLAAYKVLLASIWRANDAVMGSYLASLIGSRISVEEFKIRARRPGPNWVRARLTGNFSFLDKVIKPMISDAQKLVASIDSEYQTGADGRSTFSPGYATRKLLASNMDLLYEPENPSPRFKKLACQLDQKYVSGEDDIGTTVSLATLLMGPFGKLVPIALRVVKLEKLIEGSQFVNRALAVMGGASVASGVAMAADSAYEACKSRFANVNKSSETCSADATIEDMTEFESRALEKNNCALLIVSTAVSEGTLGHASKKLTDLFGSNPQMATYISQANRASQAALRVKTQAQEVQGSAGSAKDFIDLLSPPKKDDSGDKDE